MKLLALIGILMTVPMLVACAFPRAAPQPTPAPTAPEIAPTAAAIPPTESGAFLSSSSQAGGPPKQFSAPPVVTIETSATYTATIRTNRGNIEVKLFAAQTPITVNNFVFLAREGFYDGVLFHRVIPGFMIQGGDPTGTGAGGPGYRFEDEIVASLVFDKPGLLAMANAGPGTNGSQFFITVAPTLGLTGKHTIFGEVVQGQDVAEAISMVARDGDDRPTEPVIIGTIEVTQSSR